MTAPRPRAAEIAYCLLLRLYPSSFYQQFAADMRTDVREEYVNARRRGRTVAARFVVLSHVDLARTVASQWLRTPGFVIGGTSLAVSAVIWTGAIWIASREWPGGPATPRFVIQLVSLLGACAVLALWPALRRTSRQPRS
jgi:hypothetical protein